jgi:hypothetical protein
MPMNIPDHVSVKNAVNDPPKKIVKTYIHKTICAIPCVADDGPFFLL